MFGHLAGRARWASGHCMCLDEIIIHEVCLSARTVAQNIHSQPVISIKTSLHKLILLILRTTSKVARSSVPTEVAFTALHLNHTSDMPIISIAKAAMYNFRLWLSSPLLTSKLGHTLMAKNMALIL